MAGVSLARALVGGGSLLVDDERLFALAAEIEGHPDNVAPALHGGLAISGREDGRFFAVPAVVDPRVSVVVFVPPTPLETTVARGLLPATVPHADAAANAGRAALLVAALGGHPEHLLLATRDWLHQDYRAAAMPESAGLVRSLRADGVPALISGAGPDGPGVLRRAGVHPRVGRGAARPLPRGLGGAPPRGRARGRPGRLTTPAGEPVRARVAHCVPVATHRGIGCYRCSRTIRCGIGRDSVARCANFLDVAVRRTTIRQHPCRETAPQPPRQVPVARKNRHQDADGCPGTLIGTERGKDLT